MNRQIVKNLPTICTVVGGISVVSTAVFASLATKRALELTKDQELTKKEIFLLVYKEYIPTVISGGLGIFSIFYSNKLHLKRNAALASVAAVGNAAYKEYRSIVRDRLGKKEEQKIKEEVIENRIRKDTKRNFIECKNTGTSLCYDSMSGRYFYSDINALKSGINNINAMIINKGEASLNDFYYLIGLSETKIGNEVGWSQRTMEATCLVTLAEFNLEPKLTDDGEPCIALVYDVYPI